MLLPKEISLLGTHWKHSPKSLILGNSNHEKSFVICLTFPKLSANLLTISEINWEFSHKNPNAEPFTRYHGHFHNTEKFQQQNSATGRPRIYNYYNLVSLDVKNLSTTTSRKLELTKGCWGDRSLVIPGKFAMASLAKPRFPCFLFPVRRSVLQWEFLALKR